MTYPHFIRQCVCFLIVLVHVPIQAQEGVFHYHTQQQLNDTLVLQLLPEYYDLFAEEEPLEIRIESNFKKLHRNKKGDVYQMAFVTYPLNDSLEIRQQAAIKPRGGVRRKLCVYPPLKIKFSVTDLYEDRLEDLSSLKIVVECKAGNTYRNLLLKEYLVYRLYNLIDDKSFKVRLLKVDYIDTGRKKKCREAFAFFIEKPKNMARRLDGVLLEGKAHQQRYANETQETQLAMFQYMIGNTDYYVPAQHNVKIFRSFNIQDRAPYLIPYDFDYCGIVNAPYAIPHEDLGINHIRERIYRGYCRDEEVIDQQIQFFLEKKEALYQIIKDFTHLDDYHKNDMIKYLDTFYAEINSPQQFKRNLQTTCLK